MGRFYEELLDKLDDGDFNLHTESDIEDAICYMDRMLSQGEVTKEEHLKLICRIEELTDDFPESILKDMIRCDPDFA